MYRNTDVTYYRDGQNCLINDTTTQGDGSGGGPMTVEFAGGGGMLLLDNAERQ